MRVRGRGTRGRMSEGYFEMSEWSERGNVMYGNSQDLANVVCVENVDENICELVEKEELAGKRKVVMSETGISITMPEESSRKEVIDREGADESGEEESRLEADEREATADGETSASSQARQAGEQTNRDTSNPAVITAQASLLGPQAEYNRPIVQQKAGEEEESRRSQTENVGQEVGYDSEHSADHSTAATASEGLGEKEPAVTRDGEKVGEEQAGISQSGLEQSSTGQGEGKGEEGGKAKQRESVAKGSRLSLGGKGDAGASAARKLAQFRAPDRKGGEKGGSDKGGKQKKDGGGAGRVTTRSQMDKK